MGVNYAEKIKELIKKSKQDNVDIQPYEKSVRNNDKEIVVERGIAISAANDEIKYIPTWKLK